MHTTQHTIQQAVKLLGVGIHTGCPVTLTCLPAAPDHGIKFQRVDVPDRPTIEATADRVVDVTRSTTLGCNGVRIGTVEHILAALSGLEIDNALIQLDGPEVPIMDGSALPFVEAFQQAGLVEQGVSRHFFQIKESLLHRDEAQDVELAAFPLADYRLIVMIGYDATILESQHASLAHIGDFAQEVAPCRTFSFLHELEALHSQGLIRGGYLDNAVVIVDRGRSVQELACLAKLFNRANTQVTQADMLNSVTLRYPNEPARHKLLDLVGDLALVGQPIKGQVVAHKPGHAANVAFAKKLRKMMLRQDGLPIPRYNINSKPVFDSRQITKILPHRYPFQLVDKVIQLDDRTVTGIKNVTVNEPFFQGHFPNNPVMPGVLQIEAIVQTGGILVLNTVPDPEHYSTYFLAIDKCRFRKMVLPGDTLVMRCELLANIKRGIAKMKGSAFVDNKLACEAIMLAQIVKDKA
ncbi:MAG: bifunctional UDP-3-O-[3-hydroxymyristoyl] N-acetylglucosamine deacetylase/3-hydroxyacyl-ACP dehydratase [Bacteroidota bacterium]